MLYNININIYMQSKKLFPLKTEAKQELFWGLLAISAMSVFVLATLFFEQSLVLYFFALVLVFLSTVMHPAAGLYCILLCTMWFERHFTLVPLEINAVVYKIYPLDFCILFIFLSVGARFIEGKYKWKQQPLDWFILIFGAVCSLGFMSAYWRQLNMALAFGTYKNYFIYAIVYFLAVVILNNKAEWIKLARWLIFGGVGVFFFLFYGLVVGKGLWSEYTPLSTAGERLIAGTHVFYLMIFFFLLLACYLYCQEKLGTHWWKKILLIIGMALCGVALVVSLVRHLWIAMAFIIIFWLIFLPGIKLRLKYLIAITLTGVLTVIMLFGYTHIGKIIHQSKTSTEETPMTIVDTSGVLAERVAVEQVAEGSDSSFHWRMVVWRTGYTAWLAHPFLGLGLGYEISGEVYDWPFHIALREIHNDYLAILYQLGMIGFIAVAEWFVYLWYRFFKERTNILSAANDQAGLFFGFWSVVVLFMVGFVISIYWDINLFVIWWWLALALVRMLWISGRSVKKINYDDSSN